VSRRPGGVLGSSAMATVPLPPVLAADATSLDAPEAVMRAWDGVAVGDGLAAAVAEAAPAGGVDFA
jgi:hypothetical protein